MIDGLTRQELKRIMQDLGYRAETPADNPNVIRSAASGWKFVVFLYNHDDGPKFDSIQLFMGFGDIKYSSGGANQWNRDFRYTKLTVDGEGYPGLEWDVPLFGVTLDYLKRCFAVWELSIQKFADLF